MPVGGWRKEWKERKVGLEKGEQQSKTCISMFFLQKCAITKVPSVLECTYKNALFMWKCPFSQYFTMPFWLLGETLNIYWSCFYQLWYFAVIVIHVFLFWNYTTSMNLGYDLCPISKCYSSWHCSFEPCHDIMALFILHKLILQTRMRSHPVGLDVWFCLDPLSTSILHVCEQRSLWQDCVDAQARQSLCWSPMW